MASRENQGLHIALILLVMLTVGLCVLSFVFYSKAETQRGEAEGAEQLDDATADLRQGQFQVQTLTYMITGQGKSWNQIADELENIPGSDDDPTMNQIAPQFRNNMMLFGPADERPRDSPQLRIAARLPAVAYPRPEPAADRPAGTEDQLTAGEDGSGANSRRTFETPRGHEDKPATTWLANARNSRRTWRICGSKWKRLPARSTEKDNADRRIEHAARRRTMRLDKRIDDMAKIVDDMRIKIENLEQTSFEVPDAIVTIVNQKEGVLYIDVGSADNLKVQQTSACLTRVRRAS